MAKSIYLQDLNQELLEREWESSGEWDGDDDKIREKRSKKIKKKSYITKLVSFTNLALSSIGIL